MEPIILWAVLLVVFTIPPSEAGMEALCKATHPQAQVQTVHQDRIVDGEILHTFLIACLRPGGGEKIDV